MTRIAPFDGLQDSGPLGFGTKRTQGSHIRTALSSARGGTRRGISAFEPSARPSAPHAATPWALSALGLGIGLAATAAVVSGLASATSSAAAALWHDSRRRGKVGIYPAALHLHSTPARPPESSEPVSVLIAMRHRPDPAVAAVRAALCQRGVDHLDVVVIDDGCPQETRAALRREFGDDPRVRILAAAPLPRGWSPRAHRFHQLAVAARGRVLIFAEPCAPLGPHAAASATALLRGEQLDLAVLDTGRPASASTSTPESASSTSTSTTASAGEHSDGDNSARVRASGRPASGAEQPNTAPSPAATGHWAGPTQSEDSRQPKARASRPSTHHRSGLVHGVMSRTHPGRFTVAVDADAYWRIGGYRAAATDPDPLALLRTVRRASGRVAVADGRRVIPPAQLLDPLPAPDPAAEAHWDSQHSSRASITGTARRVLAALVGARS